MWSEPQHYNHAMPELSTWARWQPWYYENYPAGTEFAARRHHFVTAIEHLQAAGLHDEANRLRDRYRDLLPEQLLREAAHRGEHNPDEGRKHDAMQELRDHTEHRLNELQHELEETRQDGQRRWDELERELRQQFEDVKHEMSRRLEELSLQVERSRRDGSGYGR